MAWNAASPKNRAQARLPGHLGRGGSTATPANLEYRLGKLRERGLLHGIWLDCGCATGGYAFAMNSWGVDRVLGIDVEFEPVSRAQRMSSPQSPVSFCCATSENMPFPSASFDGVLLNEVLDHVIDEVGTLREIRRVMRPGGVLALVSPNRWFPFDGHGMSLAGIAIDKPVPFLPWLPSKLVMRFLRARNYWPNELRRIVRGAGFEIIHSESVFPVLEAYPWLPTPVIRWYRRALPVLEGLPGIRNFGVSTLIIARRSTDAGFGRTL